jgi:arylsulfatase A-like enzyme
MVALVDWVVGEILEALDRWDLTDDTLLIVTSDNGARPADVDGNTYGHKSCGDLRGFKADIWDGGHREPFIVRWPRRIKAGAVSDETICLADLLATCAAIVGVELPDNVGEDSYNILPVLLGEPLDGALREATVHHSYEGMFSIRQREWKLILGLGSGGFSEPRHIAPRPNEPTGQLYDMKDDIAETTNLWAERPEIVERLATLLDAYRVAGRSRSPKP